MPDDNDIVFTTYGLDVEGLFRSIFSLFGSGVGESGAIAAWLSTVWNVYSVLAFLLAALFIFGTIKAYLMISEYSAKNDERLAAAQQMWQQLHNGTQTGNERWQGVLQHAASPQPNDWKLALIEADIMLGDALDAAGYVGATIGEQLKGATATQLQSLQAAWDAHRLRNRVAHEGSDFVLTQSEANAAVVKFERALRELGAL